MRVIAGPNGSGKSTILRDLDPEWIGIYVNADDLQIALTSGPVDLAASYSLVAGNDLPVRLRAALESHGLLVKRQLTHLSQHVKVQGSSISVSAQHVSAYLAAAISDFIRRELLAAGESFTFETVMSSPDKVQFMEEARAAGYRTYLYFVATDNPQINISRVKDRVAQGGHDVPEYNIIDRYAKSIGLLQKACEAANRAYIFDNSGEAHKLLAQVIDYDEMIWEAEDIPAWFAETEVFREFRPEG